MKNLEIADVSVNKKLKVQICSDLHLEFPKNREWLEEHPIIPSGQVLVIAGDTYYLDRSYAELEFIKKVTGEFEKVFLIPGNHEYYTGYDISTALETTYLEVTDNVYMVNNYCEIIEGVNFVFSTMWSKIQRNIMQVMRGMADFEYIKYKGEKFNVDHFNEIHEYAFKFISDSVKTESKNVIVTHHLPSHLCNAKEFKGSVLNEAFCVEKTDFILDSKIDFWIYGHSHRNIGDFDIGNTRMITNQLGYVGWGEQKTFEYDKVISV